MRRDGSPGHPRGGTAELAVGNGTRLGRDSLRGSRRGGRLTGSGLRHRLLAGLRLDVLPGHR
ncbi:hypothetical protein, partial [Streptomyces thermospinosisporus]|uniref:hypothetical protein n=1 Tax=Streptomyces thermospinosisporus TaxID=161482 RepID=UPI003CD0B38A